MIADEAYLQRAIDLAMQGRGSVEPNPLVGCVIVKNDQVIGQGYHQRFGQTHAEPNALASCTQDPRGGTAYVTLEPCCHHNKKTPPCAPRLIEAGLKRVVIGCMDPNPAVNGRGAALLRSAGIQVDAPVLENECRQLIAPFIAFMVHQRPYVTLKWAQSADGKVAGAGGRAVQISDEKSWQAVHRLRARCDGIMIGSGTALGDDPLLTPRRVKRLRPRLLRIVLDSHLRLSPSCRLASTVDMDPTLVFCQPDAAESDQARQLRHLGVEVIGTEGGDGQLSLGPILTQLRQRNVMHLLVEPGPTLARGFFSSGLVDRLWTIHSPMVIDEPDAPTAAAIPEDFALTGQIMLGDDQLCERLNPASPVFFSRQQSADFVLLSGQHP
ncbi:MAG: bifunctional diaminohydroxyphosphoribosylaminopyrimidine deaminase/5-amino-6-(5-phosphoribosylamino)uracil reductase RibD [Phycisphaerales bacterium]|nr:bifunctional diaminohydroxyphosphoribosylaminopyrimidine deaminase/5-amino-6-(5-phosphoribosylamino)uracil reductase RibD [Phycisphaerales bacterium]